MFLGTGKPFEGGYPFWAIRPDFKRGSQSMTYNESQILADRKPFDVWLPIYKKLGHHTVAPIKY